MNSCDRFRVRVMRPHEIAIAFDWAAAEGWNPGLSDAACFTAVDPGGFMLGEVEDDPVATITVINYDDRFSFLGFYIVRPDQRGHRYGLRTWQAGMAHAGSRVVGLDGVLAQQANYKKSGFTLAYRNIRFGGRIHAAAAPPGVLPLKAVPFEMIEADDATVFPAPRRNFLRCWIGAPAHAGCALLHDGRLGAWGVIRPCRNGFKIGPLVADDAASAAAVLAALVADVGGAEVFLDVPEPNRPAIKLAEAHGLAPVFETARMYTGPIRPVALPRIFGVTTFELG
jgi:Acetyltransferase (GNAT) domain/Acetyltransferase (GNAT) family